MGYKYDCQNRTLCYSTEQYNANMSAKISPDEKTFSVLKDIAKIVRPLTPSHMTRVSLYSHTSTLLSLLSLFSLFPPYSSWPFTLKLNFKAKS